MRRVTVQWRVALVAALWVLAAWGPDAQIVDRVLAVVDGELVTLSDLRTARALGIVEAADDAAAVAQLVDRALMLAEVSRYAPPEPARDVVEGRLAALRDVVGAARFAEVLKQGGLDEESLRRRLRQDLLLDAYVTQRFTATAQPTDGEVETYLAEHRSELTGQGGAPLAGDDAVRAARSRLMAERRSRLVEDWLAGLRRRADISVRPVSPP
jgi:peptidyl-prolyl cis-trans isomerase SurA